MHIRKYETLHNEYGGFELDATQISNTTLYKDKIFLPYNGPLPDALTGGKAAIGITLQVGLTINVLLYVHQDGTTKKFPVQASGDELHDILMGFFFEFKNNKGFTRFGCGLNRYWLGINQDAFIQWKRIVRDTYGFVGIVDQLSPENKARLIRHLAEDKAA